MNLKNCVLTWAALCLMSSASMRAALIDVDGDGVDDVWQVLFAAKGLPASEDTDGDGFTTVQESWAGTDPRDPTSHPRLGLLSNAPTGLRWAGPSVPGKEYVVEGVDGFAPNPVWKEEARWLAFDRFFERPLTSIQDRRFFRLRVGDVDTDSDGVTDYNERVLGLDPFADHSQRDDLTDRQRAPSLLKGVSVVSVSTLDAEIFERWPDPGVVAIRRGGALLPLRVAFTLSGTAIPEIDYQPSALDFIQFPLGVREVWVTFSALADAWNDEPTETIRLTVQPGPGYSLSGTNSAWLTVRNEMAGSLPNSKSAARFLLQAAFGPDQDTASDGDMIPENVEDVMRLGFDGWIEDQFQRPLGLIQPWVDWAVIHGNARELYGNWKENSWWNRVMGVPKLRPDDITETTPDPLRQRVAFALSQILVVSDRPEQLAVEQQGMAHYYDLMVRHAFGNYRDLLLDVALHPAMGIYLSHLGNRKADPSRKIYPDENFAREILQLFTIGLWELNPDGTRRTDPNGHWIPTYDNRHITELARVFTGLSFGNNANFTLYPRDFTQPMKIWDAEHDCGAKQLLGGLILPARTPSPGNQGLAGTADVQRTITHLFEHPNVGPFIGRQLIQRFVTSNPSTGYVARVAEAFRDNGAGVRGDMKAVVRAVLLDVEARDPARMEDPAWGKLREPFLRVVNFARAFNAASSSGWFPLDQFSLDHLQDPMNAPSVFNFFLPNHSPPGPLTQQGLSAPEFQILNASSAITGPNYFWNSILGDLHRYGVGNSSYAVRLNLNQELSLIVPASQIAQDVPQGPPLDPDPLLSRLDLALTGGTLAPEQFQIIREAMLRIRPPVWQWHRERLRLAIYLIVTTPDFNVLR